MSIQLKRTANRASSFNILPGQLVADYSYPIPRLKIGNLSTSIEFQNASYLTPNPTIYQDSGIYCEHPEQFYVNGTPINQYFTEENKPTKIDVGLGQVSNLFSAATVSGYTPNNNPYYGYIQVGKLRWLFQRFSLSDTGTGTQLATSGIYVREIEVNWSFQFSFKQPPAVIVNAHGINYRLIQVKACNVTANGIGSVQIYTYTDNFATGATIYCIAVGEVA